MKVFIHVGYPKAASTFFQKVIFPKIEGVFFETKPFIFDNILMPSPLEYNARKIRKYVENKLKETGNDNILLSYELLVGSSQTGGYNFMLTVCNAEKLKKTFPEAKIILFIRNQLDIIASTYCQYLKAGGNYGIKSYLKNTKYSGDNLMILFNYKFFLYDQVIELYRKIFGKENVYVFLYEEFRDNQEVFLRNFLKTFNFTLKDNKILELDKRINLKYHYLLFTFIRFINSFVRGKKLNKYYIIHIPGLFNFSRKILVILNLLIYKLNNKNPSSRILKKENVDYISNYYKKSNQSLINKYNLKEIKKYNYPL